MPRSLFINLCVSDLTKSMNFFKSLGFKFNEQFTNDTAACLVLSETNYAMLITPARFKEFTPKAIADTSKTTEVLVAFDCSSRQEVDQITEAAFAAGGTACRDAQDHGFMYGRSFQDLDGHIWEPFWMDPTAIKSE
ncbi:VOC family protein [Schlesneria paludicola]|uniref:VOC family protein n=1 Tax=Schlesneria paludicola TaxID=360056 RepID=UPI000492A52C|nr:VOC family protein [Schlesneria paludicola]